MNEELKIKIKNLLSTLYLVDSCQGRAILSRLPTMSEAAFLKIIEILEKSEAKQQSILKKFNEKNSNFNQAFKRFLDDQYRATSINVTNLEHASAENILKDL